LRAQHDREEAEVRRATSGHLHPLYHDRHWLLSEHDVSYSLSTHPMEYCGVTHNPARLPAYG
jgi:hypothetical protein